MYKIVKFIFMLVLLSVIVETHDAMPNVKKTSSEQKTALIVLLGAWILFEPESKK